MSAHETCPAIPSTSSTENSAPPGDPQNVSQVVVKKENQEHLYIDFASDTPPVGLAASQQLTKENSNNAAGPAKKIDPRQQWINTDRAKPYFCKLCDFNMESMEFFQHHCMSPRHIKRAIEEFNIKIPKRLEEKEEKKPPPEFNCQVCLVSCNSDTAWNSHLLGQKHRKALEKQGAERAQQKAHEKAFMMNTVNTGFGQGAGRGVGGRGTGGRGGHVGPIRGGGYTPGHSRKPYDKPLHTVQQPSLSGPIGARDFATYPEPLIGLEYVTEIQVIGQSPRYHCELCDSKFDHNLKFPHLVGSKHRFNVLKEKVPEAAQNIRGDVKKRSELSSKLLEEAHKLEMREGRQQVKTRMEKSPFNRINNQAAGRGGLSGNNLMQQMSRGGGQQWQSQRGGGQARGRGGQMAARGGTQGFVRGGGQGGIRGGGRGRGNQQGTHFTSHQQSTSNRGGRGRGRGSWGNNQYQSWKQESTSYSSTPNQPYHSGSSYGGNDDSFPWETSSHGEGERMLPAEAFKPRSPPRTHSQQQFNSNYHDEYYDDYYGRGNQNPFGNSSAYAYDGSHPGQSSYSTQTSTAQQFQSHSQPTSTSSGNTGTSGGGSGDKSVSLLQGAIADLGKLVSNEEDASVALQVSNALTQALLQFRMNNLPQEGHNSAGAAGTDTPMNTGT